MNDFILSLFDAFHRERITYCHFKSNNNLGPALAGVDDLDLLVARADATRFLELIASHGFRVATDRNSVPTPFVFHFFGVDPNTALIVHLHVYFRIVTGGSILKNHWIPVEKMFLQNRIPEDNCGVMIPCAEADLILFVIRKFIEQPSIIEHYLFLKDFQNIRAEFDWLISLADRTRLRLLAKEWLPQVPVSLLDDAIDLLSQDGNMIARIRLGRAMRRCFQNTVHHELKASLLRSAIFVKAHLKARIGTRRSERFVFPGGMIISFIGSEASGKSTLSREIYSWLKTRFDACHIHLGKPPKNWRTKPIWLFIASYTRLKAFLKMFRFTSSIHFGDGLKQTVIAENLPHPIVSLLDSIDRRHWLLKHSKKMMEGSIIVTDRYPSPLSGLDGSRIIVKNTITRWLARLESLNYRGLPSPDIVFKTIAPLDVTLRRNSLRDCPEPKAFVQSRYLQAQQVNFPISEEFEINTTNNLNDTLLRVKKLIWFGDA